MDIPISVKYNQPYKVSLFLGSVLLPNIMNEAPNTVGDTLIFSSNILSLENITFLF